MLKCHRVNNSTFEQACPDDGVSFRQVQCSEFNDIPYKGNKYEWIPVATPGTSSRFFPAILSNQKVFHVKRIFLLYLTDSTLLPRLWFSLVMPANSGCVLVRRILGVS